MDKQELNDIEAEDGRMKGREGRKREGKGRGKGKGEGRDEKGRDGIGWKRN